MLLSSLMVFFAVFVGVWVLGARQNEGAVYSRLKEMAAQGKQPDARKAELSRPLRERIMQPLLTKAATKLSSSLPQERLQNLDSRLEQADHPLNLQAGEWLAFKWAVCGITGVLTLLFGEIAGWHGTKVIIVAFLFAVFLALFFEWELTRRINDKKKQIEREMPDVLDLLTISVEAGLGFDGAMGKVVEKGKGILADEFRRVLREMKVGMSRQEALKDMSKRLDVEALKTLVNSLVQADQLGMGMTQVLRTQAQQVRQNRKQAAEETAMKAPVKMLFPLVFFIFPTIFIVLLGPAALQIIKVFSGGTLQ